MLSKGCRVQKNDVTLHPGRRCISFLGKNIYKYEFVKGKIR